MNRRSVGLVALVVSSSVLAACRKEPPAPAPAPPVAESGSGAPAAATTEAERTRAMEEQAAEMNRRMEEARASGQDPAQALDQFERDRAELNRIAEGQPPADEPVEPPPPAE
jgi:hypothetical protein